MKRGLTPAEISTLPAVVDLVTAGRALGLGRTKAYELARAGEFPCRVLRVGKTYLVPTAGLLGLLGLDASAAQPPPEDR
ncbi:DNA-binding protein [Actinomadura sp. HBU206391]|uniref:DNA-binding protein n=1 Tax=Actinomadura sp. HBU206391 TaxID=2731692 RepID=UPI00164FC756|nr:DNA-binding protein [Actinomadura sp. HBU206391]MBC6463168.1 DNA-binding protein [Actinomadura sp. HBU206391]